jgi:hypothetical protein
MRNISERDYERLNSYIHDGTIHYEQKENQWVGKASDGVEVGLGDTKDKVAKYLADRPEPNMW